MEKTQGEKWDEGIKKIEQDNINFFILRPPAHKMHLHDKLRNHITLNAGGSDKPELQFNSNDLLPHIKESVVKLFNEVYSPSA